MLNSFFKASLLTLLVSTSSYAQTTTESITINWQEQPRTYQLPDGNTLHYLYFEKANYNGTEARLPIFSKQIRLNSYGDLTARLVNEQYSPLTNT
ncbi:hypothetical protein, partial [Aureispira sp. CCB-QB1]|uniref:hypothetical protein n=1 Tax=Aureispira sp. CCB-QB1 TaxID=1313421 RepID=UPI000697C071